jgi:Na+/phosphate symporter
MTSWAISLRKMIQFRLRTLLIVLTVAPPVVSLIWWAVFARGNLFLIAAWAALVSSLLLLALLAMGLISLAARIANVLHRPVGGKISYPSASGEARDSQDGTR